MMNEIKFRQRNKNNGRWHYWGQVSKDKWQNPYLQPNYEDPDKSNQYTGLKDKNGTLIFESDILRVGCGGPSIVIWESCGFRREYKDTGESYFLSGGSGYEVIGNIHENGDLLK